ncbi:MAG TPA: hypothetical protein VD948_01585 [Rhodothermales bacterium]|nr:hypothetical protein [Rhodothermales bacterium]
MKRLDFGVLTSCFEDVLARYDPQRQVILCAYQRKADLLSAYVLRLTPTPPQAYRQRMNEQARRDASSD